MGQAHPEPRPALPSRGLSARGLPGGDVQFRHLREEGPNPPRGLRGRPLPFLGLLGPGDRGRRAQQPGGRVFSAGGGGGVESAPNPRSPALAAPEARAKPTVAVRRTAAPWKQACGAAELRGYRRGVLKGGFTGQVFRERSELRATWVRPAAQGASPAARTRWERQRGPSGGPCERHRPHVVSGGRPFPPEPDEGPAGSPAPELSGRLDPAGSPPRKGAGLW